MGIHKICFYKQIIGKESLNALLNYPASISVKLTFLSKYITRRNFDIYNNKVKTIIKEHTAECGN